MKTNIKIFIGCLITFFALLCAYFALDYQASPIEVKIVEIPDIQMPVGNIANELNWNMQPGNFNSASTTVFAVQNPYSTTSTLEMLIFDQTTATTTSLTLDCGTSTVQFTAPGDSLIDDFEIPTSTTKTVMNGVFGAGANSQSRIEVGPDEYVTCRVTQKDPDIGDFTDSSNPWAGKYTLLWYQWPR